MAKDSKKADDLELTPDKAGDVKGGVIPGEPGGGGSRHIAGKKKVHKAGGAPKPLPGSMPHH